MEHSKPKLSGKSFLDEGRQVGRLASCRWKSEGLEERALLWTFEQAKMVCEEGRHMGGKLWIDQGAGQSGKKEN